ncbi:unnamed protein product [Ceutorhynchus assimilis]|uniref:Uncharacterized protein n=1 Tax=Ceutorhynchus assimilis TaxID=467358 RepID=A0A9N9N336_9CUCU|nr:unnamed protein product [Ceutorhynchus assimilis]
MASTVAYRGHVVDSDGKVISHQEMSDGEIFVNLNDMQRATGVKLFSPDEKLREKIEAKIFNYFMECVIESRRIFSEEQIIDSFERVRTKLFYTGTLALDKERKTPYSSQVTWCWVGDWSGDRSSMGR